MSFIKLYHSKLHIISFLFYLTAIYFIFSCATIQSTEVIKKENRHTDESYYNNGQIEYSAEYLNNKLDGISKHWSIDGILISESEYSNGMPHGRWKKYYKNQAILYEVNYFHGKKQGDEKWYYENGEIKSEQTFHHGVPNSVLIRWHPDGTIVY